MNIFKKNKGAITVYICMILSIMLVLTGVLVDGARARVAEAQVQSAVEASANSLLANYNNILKEWFGLMALSENNPSVLEEDLLYYLNKNLMTELGAEKENMGDKSWDYLKKFLNIKNEYEDVRFLDMYDYRIDYLKIVPLYNLAENEVIRAQIVEYMKYRGPEALGEEFLEKINVFRSYKKQAKTLSSKLEVDKSLNSISKELGELYKRIENVNSYAPAEIKEMIEEIGDKIALKVGAEKVYKEKREKRIEVQEKLDEHRKTDEYKSNRQLLLKELSLAQDEEEKDIIREQIKDLDEPYKSELEKAEEDEKEAKDQHNFIAKEAKKEIDNMFSYLKKFESFNKDAERKAVDIKGKTKNIKTQIESLKKDIAGDTSDFAERIRQDLKKIENQVSEDSMDHLIEKFNKNIDTLKALIQKLEEKNLKDIDEDYDNLSSFNNDQYLEMYEYIHRHIIAAEDLYKNYIVKYSKVTYEEFPVEKKPETKEKVDDPRDASKDLIKGSDNPLKNIEAPEKHEDFDEIKKGLPSSGSKIDSEEILKAFIDDNYEFVAKAIGYDSKSESDGKNSDKTFDINNIDFENDSNNSINDGLNLITSLIEFLETGLESIRDEIFVDEYALGTFNNYLSTKDLKVKGGNTISQVDLRLRNRSERKPYTYFENEIEYIIGGSSNEKSNINNVLAKILLIRFTLNTLHIYLDPIKMKEVYSTATIIASFAGPLIATFAVHLVAILIIMSWSMAESIIDLKLLMKGESVPIFKTKLNWILSVEGGLSKIKEKIAGTIVETAKDYAKEVADDKIDSIESLLKNSMANIKDTISTKVDNIVEKVFEPVDAALNSTDKTIKDNYSYLTESLENELSNIANDEMNAIVKEIYKIAQEEYKKVKSEIEGKLTMAIDKAKEEVENIKQSIKDTVNEKISGMEESINKKINEYAKNSKEKLNEYIDSFGSKNPISTGGYNNVKASILSFNYEEYLRLLLLMTNRDVKITRIQDLIQLQMVKMTGDKDFKLAHCNTHVGVITNVSMKYFFMSQPFVKKELQTEEFDRHNLHIMLFKGY